MSLHHTRSEDTLEHLLEGVAEENGVRLRRNGVSEPMRGNAQQRRVARHSEGTPANQHNVSSSLPDLSSRRSVDRVARGASPYYTRQPMTLKELEQKLEDLRKENFQLKLDIHHLTNQNASSMSEGEAEHNMVLNVHVRAEDGSYTGGALRAIDGIGHSPSGQTALLTAEIQRLNAEIRTLKDAQKVNTIDDSSHVHNLSARVHDYEEQLRDLRLKCTQQEEQIEVLLAQKRELESAGRPLLSPRPSLAPTDQPSITDGRLLESILDGSILTDLDASKVGNVEQKHDMEEVWRLCVDQIKVLQSELADRNQHVAELELRLKETNAALQQRDNQLQGLLRQTDKDAAGEEAGIPTLEDVALADANSGSPAVLDTVIARLENRRTRDARERMQLQTQLKHVEFELEEARANAEHLLEENDQLKQRLEVQSTKPDTQDMSQQVTERNALEGNEHRGGGDWPDASRGFDDISRGQNLNGTVDTREGDVSQQMDQTQANLTFWMNKSLNTTEDVERFRQRYIHAKLVCDQMFGRLQGSTRFLIKLLEWLRAKGMITDIQFESMMRDVSDISATSLDASRQLDTVAEELQLDTSIVAGGRRSVYFSTSATDLHEEKGLGGPLVSSTPFVPGAGSRPELNDDSIFANGSAPRMSMNVESLRLENEALLADRVALDALRLAYEKLNHDYQQLQLASHRTSVSSSAADDMASVVTSTGQRIEADQQHRNPSISPHAEPHTRTDGSIELSSEVGPRQPPRLVDGAGQVEIGKSGHSAQASIQPIRVVEIDGQKYTIEELERYALSLRSDLQQRHADLTARVQVEAGANEDVLRRTEEELAVSHNRVASLEQSLSELRRQQSKEVRQLRAELEGAQKAKAEIGAKMMDLEGVLTESQGKRNELNSEMERLAETVRRLELEGSNAVEKGEIAMKEKEGELEKTLAVLEAKDKELRNLRLQLVQHGAAQEAVQRSTEQSARRRASEMTGEVHGRETEKKHEDPSTTEYLTKLLAERQSEITQLKTELRHALRESGRGSATDVGAAAALSGSSSDETRRLSSRLEKVEKYAKGMKLRVQDLERERDDLQRKLGDENVEMSDRSDKQRHSGASTGQVTAQAESFDRINRIIEGHSVSSAVSQLASNNDELEVKIGVYEREIGTYQAELVKKDAVIAQLTRPLKPIQQQRHASFGGSSAARRGVGASLSSGNSENIPVDPSNTSAPVPIPEPNEYTHIIECINTILLDKSLASSQFANIRALLERCLLLITELSSHCCSAVQRENVELRARVEKLKAELENGADFDAILKATERELSKTTSTLSKVKSQLRTHGMYKKSGGASSKK